MKKLLVVVVLVAFATTVFAVEPRTIYVDRSVAASGDGTTWAKAFKTIQEGVNAASTEVVDTILVAPGVYGDGQYRSLDRVLHGGEPLCVQGQQGYDGCRS